MNQRDCEFIINIAREKSISGAAAKLYMSQPALSLFLTRLETQLGTKLFTRNAIGLQPTYAGECYLRTAEKIVKLCNDFEVELCNINSFHKGRIQVGATVHLGSLVFPLLLPKYKERYPNIEVLITESRSADLERALAHNDIDIALMHIPFHSVDANYKTIFRDPFVVVIARNSPLTQHIYEKKGRPYIDLHFFADEKYILAYPSQRVRQITDVILDKAGITPNITFMTSSVETAMRVASVNIGITLMPQSYISLFTCPNPPYFCQLEESYRAWWTFVAAYPKDSELSAPTAEMVDILQKIYHSNDTVK